MGTIIQERDYRPENQAGMLKPIIYCVTSKEMADAVSINKMLAEELIKVRKNRRTMQLERCLSQVISKLPDGAVIKDLDVLFNPEYQVDVLKMLVTVCKQKTFSVIWPGRMDGEKLFYAEEGFPDYKSYNISDYDITCIV
jgi:hypothetical protein